MLGEYSLFLGCIVPNRYPGIEAATKMMFDKLKVTLRDMPGASCCPAPGVVGSFSEKTWMTVAARNITVAEQNGTDIVTLCNGCFGTLFEVNSLLKEDAKTRKNINESLTELGRTFEGSVEVHHFAKLIFDNYLKQTINLGKKRLEGLRIAVHYGCHLLRPKNLKKMDNPEKPSFVDEIVRGLGAQTIDYKDKNMCCGAGGGVRASFLDVALDMTREKLENVKQAKADCILNVCSFCHLQFDRGQKELEENMNLEFNMPVIHLSQLIGLALGSDPSSLGLQSHAVSVEPLLKKLKVKLT